MRDSQQAITVLTSLISASPKTKRTDWDETLKMGHRPLVLMAPRTHEAALEHLINAEWWSHSDTGATEWALSG
jgi:hypothetical protein